MKRPVTHPSQLTPPNVCPNCRCSRWRWIKNRKLQFEWTCYTCTYTLEDLLIEYPPTTPNVPPDPINPDHYKSGDLECVTVMKAISTPQEFQGYLRLTAFKYGWRFDKKGQAVQDLEKQAWFIERLKQELVACVKRETEE